MGYILIGSAIVYHDISKRKIPNILLSILFIVGLCSHIYHGQSLVWPLMLFVMGFLVGYLLYGMSILGAGDGKFIAVSLFYFAYYPILHQVLAIALIGGVYALGVYITRWLKYKNFKRAFHEAKTHTIPYGLPIFLGSMLGVTLGGIM